MLKLVLLVWRIKVDTNILPYLTPGIGSEIEV